MRARTAPLRGRVLFSLLGLAAALLAACTPGIGFPDPSNPVAGIPWPDYELLRYDITDQTELKLGTVDFEIERLDDEFRIRVHFLLPQSGAEDEIVLHIDARTLAPLRYERLATTLDERIEVTATYGVDADGRRFLDSLVVNGDDREQASPGAGRTLLRHRLLRLALARHRLRGRPGAQLSLRQRLRPAQPAGRPARPRPG